MQMMRDMMLMTIRAVAVDGSALRREIYVCDLIQSEIYRYMCLDIFWSDRHPTVHQNPSESDRGYLSDLLTWSDRKSIVDIWSLSDDEYYSGSLGTPLTTYIVKTCTPMIPHNPLQMMRDMMLMAIRRVAVDGSVWLREIYVCGLMQSHIFGYMYTPIFWPQRHHTVH